ncbi:MAG: AsmA family protein [Alphaproteobacteria bacterium]|nr:AsmA family protein [Alphaproteobacteria bacterium]
MRAQRSIFFPIVRILTLFVVGLIVAAVVALSSVNLETLRGNLLGLMRDATGLPVEIDGAVSWRFSLRPRVELNQVRIPNAEWAKHKYAFSAEKVDVTLNLISLFRDRPTIQNVKVYDANICVEKNSDGKYSVQSLLNKPAVDAATEQVVQKYPIKSMGFGRLEIKNLTAHIIDDYYSLAGFNIKSRFKRDGREYSGWLKADGDVFPFIIDMSEYNAERKVYPVRVAISTGGDALIANLALEGKSKLPIDFVVKGDITRPDAFGKIFGADWSKIPSVSVNMAGGLNRKKLTLRKSSVYLRNTEFDISGEYDWGKSVPSISLNLESKYVSLARLFPKMYDGQWVRPDRDLNAFKDVPLFGDWFVNKDINAHVVLDSFVVYRDLDLRKTDVRLNLKNNQGTLSVKTNIGDGDMELAGPLTLDSDGRISIELGGKGRDIFVGEIISQVHKADFLSDLPVNIDLYLQAGGRDLSELMGSLTGPVQVYSVGSGYAHSALVAYMYGTDFLTSLRHSVQDLFRSEKKHNQIKVSCMAFNAMLRDGQFETQNGFAIETNAINIRLAGGLDFGQEEMHLALTTVPVRGLKLSLTGNVVNSIELTGSLAEPDIRISGAAVAGKVASATGIGLLLAPFTGGLSLVAGAGVGLLAGDLLENWLADDKPCRTAMERGAPLFRDDPEWMATPAAELAASVMTK